MTNRTNPQPSAAANAGAGAAEMSKASLTRPVSEILASIARAEAHPNYADVVAKAKFISLRS